MRLRDTVKGAIDEHSLGFIGTVRLEQKSIHLCEQSKIDVSSSLGQKGRKMKARKRGYRKEAKVS
jgi:hypothetical protein